MSLEKSMSIYESNNQRELHKINTHLCLEEVPKDIDLAIIATTANGREEIINSIIGNHRVKAWIIEN